MLCSFIYILSIISFLSQQQSWAVWLKPHSLQNLKCLIFGHLHKKYTHTRLDHSLFYFLEERPLALNVLLHAWFWNKIRVLLAENWKNDGCWKAHNSVDLFGTIIITNFFLCCCSASLFPIQIILYRAGRMTFVAFLF